MGVPAFLLRKLYKRGTLRETADGRFGFSIQNPLATAHLIGPPRFVINGVAHEADQVDAGDIDLAVVSRDQPLEFHKGDEIELRFHGRLLRGGNRIHLFVPTSDFGDIELLVEDREAEFCDLPAGEEE